MNRNQSIIEDFPRPDVALDLQIQEALAALGLHVQTVAFVSKTDAFPAFVVRGAILTRGMMDSGQFSALPVTQVLTSAPMPIEEPPPADPAENAKPLPGTPCVAIAHAVFTQAEFWTREGRAVCRGCWEDSPAEWPSGYSGPEAGAA